MMLVNGRIRARPNNLAGRIQQTGRWFPTRVLEMSFSAANSQNIPFIINAKELFICVQSIYLITSTLSTLNCAQFVLFRYFYYIFVHLPFCFKCESSKNLLQISWTSWVVITDSLGSENKSLRTTELL